MEHEVESEGAFGVDFLWNRYRTLQSHLERTYAHPGAENTTDRRHELYLRELIEKRDFDLAGNYVDRMAEFCESIHDSAAAERYKRYSGRVAELRQAEA